MTPNETNKQGDISQRPKKRVRIAPVVLASDVRPTVSAGFELATTDMAEPVANVASSKSAVTFADHSTSSSTGSSSSSSSSSSSTTSSTTTTTTSTTPTSSQSMPLAPAIVQRHQECKQQRNSVPEATTAQPPSAVKQLHEEGQEFMCHANKVIHLWFVNNTTELDHILAGTPSTTVHPAHPPYTHQLFGDDETIIGFKDLTIDLIYSSKSSHLLYRETFSDRLVTIGQQPTDNDIVDQLRECLPEGWTKDQAAFRIRLKEEEETFTPLGDVVFSQGRRIYFFFIFTQLILLALSTRAFIFKEKFKI